jgi:hypothetical protein
MPDFVQIALLATGTFGAQARSDAKRPPPVIGDGLLVYFG